MVKQHKLLTIEEASRQLKIPKHTLRFWEKTFEGMLVPLRTRGGQRRFTSENITLLEEIKELREKGMSLSDVKTELNNGGNPPRIDSSKFALLADRVAEVVKAEVYNFLQAGQED
jgi:DNA-binding transcriptional MerR regulator